nr:MAG TPA: hypothetical protein [Caudoviricetes sp.]
MSRLYLHPYNKLLYGDSHFPLPLLTIAGYSTYY